MTVKNRNPETKKSKTLPAEQQKIPHKSTISFAYKYLRKITCANGEIKMLTHILQPYCKLAIFASYFMSLKLNWDAMGIATSILCAIHCALLPVLVTTLPVFGIDIVENAVFEWGMVVLAFVVGVYSLYHGFIKHHRNYTPIYIFGVGFFFLVIKQFFKQYEYLLLAVAVLLIIVAHYHNYRLCNKSKCASPHHSH